MIQKLELTEIGKNWQTFKFNKILVKSQVFNHLDVKCAFCSNRMSRERFGRLRSVKYKQSSSIADLKMTRFRTKASFLPLYHRLLILMHTFLIKKTFCRESFLYEKSAIFCRNNYKYI